MNQRVQLPSEKRVAGIPSFSSHPLDAPLPRTHLLSVTFFMFILGNLDSLPGLAAFGVLPL